MSVHSPGSRVPAVVAGCVLTALVLTGCGQNDDEPAVGSSATASAPTASATAPVTASVPPGTPAVTESASAAPEVDKEITVTVTKRRVDPPTGRVTVGKGDLVRITVTSDVADELHVHGYDAEVRLPAGTAASVQFRADHTGLFEVETHETGLVLFQLLVR